MVPRITATSIDACSTAASGSSQRTSDTVAPVVTADGTPSIDVVRTATDCADTEHWLEVDVYGPIILDDVSPTTYGIAAATQDFAFDVVIP